MSHTDDSAPLLVIARCGRSPLLMGDVEMLPDTDQHALIDSVSMTEKSSLVQVLPSGRVAVGRRHGAKCVWWVGFELPSDPPAALWIERALFRIEGSATVPDSVDWQAVVPKLAAVRDHRQAAKLVAGAVFLLRTDDAPICIRLRADFEVQEALALTLAAVLGGGLSIAVAHPGPDPAQYRLAIHSESLPGYLMIDASDPPDEGDDLVAWFARDRLRADPSALFVKGGVTEEHVRETLETGTFERPASKEGRVRALTARIRAGTTLDDGLVRELVRVTQATADARPWAVLARRPSVVRRQAVSALLEAPERVRPTAVLLNALADLYPRGAPLEPWAWALLHWAGAAQLPDPFIDTLRRTLLEWPQAAATANRMSLWLELIGLLVQRGRIPEAEACATGLFVERLVEEGGGSGVALLWALLPSDRRNPRRLGGVVEMFASHPHGDEAAAQLYRVVEDNPAEVDVLLGTWIAARGARAVDEDDGLFVAVSDSEYVDQWFKMAMSQHAPGSILPLLPRVAKGVQDPIWLSAEAAWARTVPASQRFGNLTRLSSGRVALEPRARGLIDTALADVRFPDGRIAEAARMFTSVEGASPIWPWVAITAAQPGRFTDEVVEGTVLAVCARPPSNGVQRQVCLLAAERLGGAAEWHPLDHARWLVILSMAEDDQTGFAVDLAQSLVNGLCARFDASAHMTRLVVELMALPVDHPVLHRMLGSWLPKAWGGRVPSSFVGAVEPAIPLELGAYWRRLVDAHR